MAEDFTPTSIDDLVNRTGRPRDEAGRFLPQARDTESQPGEETVTVETQSTPTEGASNGEAHGDGDTAQADGQAAQPAGTAAAPPKTIADTAKPAPQIPLAAAQDDRAKRQAATDELAKAQARIAELEALTKAPPVAAARPQPAALTPAQRAARASVFDDENAFADGIVGEAAQRAEAAAFGRQIAMSEMYVRQTAPDFDEVMGTKVNADGNPDHTNWTALLTPELWAKFQAAPDPVRFAYDTVKKHRETQRLSDPAYIDQLVETKLAERLAATGAAKPAPAAVAAPAVPAKAQASQPAPKPAPAAPPASIANQQSSNLSRGAPQFQGPTPLDALINQVGKVQATTN